MVKPLTALALALGMAFTGAAPANAGPYPMAAHKLPHECDGATTVWTVKLVNRTDRTRAVKVTGHLAADAAIKDEARTHWVKPGEPRFIHFRSSRDRRRYWVITWPADPGSMLAAGGYPECD